MIKRILRAIGLYLKIIDSETQSTMCQLQTEKQKFNFNEVIRLHYE